MFCEKCGRPIPDGQEVCGFCNPPSQQPLHQAPQFQRAPMDLSEPAAPAQQSSYIPPVQEPLYQAPAQQAYVPPVQEPVQQAYVPPVQEPVQQAYVPPVQEPVQQAYVPPVQQPVQSSYMPPVQQPVQSSYMPPVQQPVQPSYTPPVQQPGFELNMPAEGSKRPRKKKSGGKVVLVIVALLLVAGIVLAAINWGSIVRFFKRNFAEPVAYLQDVEKENAANVASDVAAAYDNALSLYYPEGSSVDGAITLAAGDQLMTILGTVLAQSGANIDLSWVESITLSPKLEIYEDTMQVDLGIGLNNTSLATVSAVWDMESQTIYVGVPELHDTYVEMDATDILGSEAAMIAQTMAMSRQISASFVEAMPEASVVEGLINKYLGIIIDQFPEAEKATETVKAGGLEQDLLVVTMELSQKDLLEMAAAVLEEAQDDKDIKNILNAFGDSIGKMAQMYGGEVPDIYDSFSEVVDEGLEELEYLVDEAEKGTFLTIETFLDNEDAIAGRTFAIEYDGVEMEAHYITVTENGKFAFDAELETVAITGKGTIKDGKRSGSYTLSIEGTDYVTLEIENVIHPEDGALTGTFRLIPESAVYEMMDMDSSVTGILGQVALELTLDSSNVILGIEIAGSELVSFAIAGEAAKPSPISLPAGVSTDDNEGGMKWISELDLDAVVANLEKAGVPDQYMDIIDQYVELFRSEFN